MGSRHPGLARSVIASVSMAWHVDCPGQICKHTQKQEGERDCHMMGRSTFTPTQTHTRENCDREWKRGRIAIKNGREMVSQVMTRLTGMVISGLCNTTTLACPYNYRLFGSHISISILSASLPPPSHKEVHVQQLLAHTMPQEILRSSDWIEKKKKGKYEVHTHTHHLFH